MKLIFHQTIFGAAFKASSALYRKITQRGLFLPIRTKLIIKMDDHVLCFKFINFFFARIQFKP
jgi:hypothetical protein